MESLAVIAGLLFMVVVSAGPVSFVLVLYDKPHLGTVAGAFATVAGMWWWYTMRGNAISFVGVMSVLLGVASVYMASHCTKG